MRKSARLSKPSLAVMFLTETVSEVPLSFSEVGLKTVLMLRRELMGYSVVDLMQVLYQHLKVTKGSLL